MCLALLLTLTILRATHATDEIDQKSKSKPVPSLRAGVAKVDITDYAAGPVNEVLARGAPVYNVTGNEMESR